MNDMKEVFERYFTFRIQQAGAVTPGQQLQVLQQLRDEATREGRVPVSETSVVQVDLNNPAVQAVLRGEPVSIGAQTVRPANSARSIQPPWSKSSGGGVSGMSNTQKILILLAIFMLPVFIFGLIALRRGHKSSEIEILNTPTPLPTISWTATPDVLDSPSPDAPDAGDTDGSQAVGSDTYVPAAPAVLETGDHQIVYLPMDNPAAPDAVAPASVEIGGQHFIVHIGEVDPESGVWEPQGGVEWLPTTFVRRVIAVPAQYLEGMTIQEGDVIRMRMRDGFVANYQVTQVIPDLLTDRIELLNGSTPSLTIIAYTNNLRNPRRLVIVGEMLLPVSYQPVQYAPPTPVATPTATPEAASGEKKGIIAVDNVNLRSGPSIYAPVKDLLERGTEVTIHTDVPYTEADGYVWLFVDTPAGDGWVADYLVIPQE